MEHPALEPELEKALRADADGRFLADLQRSLREYVDVVETHMRSGLSMDQYRQWGDLQKAAETAAYVAEEVREFLRYH
jgi:hypothetical protein